MIKIWWGRGNIILKNILIRVGILLFDIFNVVEMIVCNFIGGNVGNLVYVYSVFCILMIEGMMIILDYYWINLEDVE